MSNLKYRTRGDSTPQGKPKVYFCCHPKDFGRFFEFISKDILSKINCAIWYNNKGKADLSEDLWLNLKQMQLFVMPVTSNLLCTENDTLNKEFAFAVENHIPVLPLMQESGLEQLFNSKCGDLQFLDKNKTDDTAISFDTKLENYLNNVLVGDEMAQKVRDAFDAYVFLSYRKKDRRYAQQLMQLIHKNEFCRDVAIWYDEFLTPGEDFNDAIGFALKKCNLFVMAVTPNLVNEENYIMTTEYPMARESKMPVLPAEMVKTDKQLLEKMYENIPQCTDANDEEELKSALTDALGNIAKRENDNDPQHNFFIGLAYLNGIDVEVDHERAVRLITDAADEGLAEAMERLVAMYRNGIGVKRDLNKAAEWKEKYIDALEKEYRIQPKKSELNNLFWEVMDCVSLYNTTGKLETAYDKTVYALKLMKEYSSIQNEKFVLFNIADCYEKIGDNFRKRGQPTKSKEYYIKSLELRRKIALNDNSPKIRYNLSSCYYKLGLLCRTLYDNVAAKEYFLMHREIICDILKEEESVKYIRELAETNEKIGHIFKIENKIDQAEEYYLASLEQYKKLEAVTKETMDYNNLAGIHISLGDICMSRKQYDKANDHYFICLTMWQKSEEKASTLSLQLNISLVCERIGNMYKAKGDTEAAKKYYQKSLKLAYQCCEKSSDVTVRSRPVTAHIYIGDVLKNEKNYDEAIKHYKISVGCAVSILKEANDKNIIRNMGSALSRLGFLYKQLKDTDKAIDYIVKFTDMYSRTMEYSADKVILNDLLKGYDALTELYKGIMDSENEEKYLTKFRDLIMEICQREDSIENRRKLLESQQKLADFLLEHKRPQEALELHLAVMRIKQDLMPQNADVKEYFALADFCCKLADRYKNEGYDDQALELYKESKARYEKNGQYIEDNYNIAALANIYFYTGEILRRKKQTREAEGNFIRYADLSLMLAEKTDKDSQWFNYALGLMRLVSIDDKSKRELMLRVKDVMIMLCQRNPTDESYRKKLADVERKLENL